MRDRPGLPEQIAGSLQLVHDACASLDGGQPRQLVVLCLCARRVGGFPAALTPRHRLEGAVRLDDGADRQSEFAPPDHVGHIAKGADHRRAGALLRIRERVRLHRHANAEERRDDLASEERLVALIVWMGHERDTRRNQLRPRRIDLDERALPARRLESDAMVRAGLLAIFELRLRHRRAEVDVPQGRRFELVGEVAPQQPKKRQLRHPLRAPVDGGVGHRPVHRQSEISPEVFEDLLVLGGQPRTQLDKVRARHRDGVLPRLVRGRERGVVRQRRIAPHAVVILHASLRRQAVVVPSHRIEHGLPAHPLEPRNHIGVGVGEDVPHVQRAADGRRRRVDRKDVGARTGAIEGVDAAGVPARHPLLFEPFEGGFVGDRDGIFQVEASRHKRRWYLTRAGITRASGSLDALDFLADEPFGDVEDRIAHHLLAHAGGDTEDDFIHHLVRHARRAK